MVQKAVVSVLYSCTLLYVDVSLCSGGASSVLVEAQMSRAQMMCCTDPVTTSSDASVHVDFLEKREGFSTSTLYRFLAPDEHALWLANSTRRILLLAHYPVLTAFHWRSKAFLWAVLAAPLAYSVGGIATVPILTRLTFGCSASLLTLVMYLAGTILAFSSILLLENANSSVWLHVIASSLCSSPIFILLGLSGGFDAVQKGSGCSTALRSMLSQGLLQWAITVVAVSIVVTIGSILSAVVLLIL